MQKLPLWGTVKRAYILAWNNRGEYFKISRSWLMLSIPIIYGYIWLIWDHIHPLLCFATIRANAKNHVHIPIDVTLLNLVPSFFILFFGSSIAVAWHRLILRNERVTTNTYLRFDKVVWGYFAFALFLRMFPLISTLLDISTLHYQTPGIQFPKSLVMFVLAIITIIITTRFSIMLPVKALNLKDISVKDVWQITHSNFWRLFIGFILCTFPVSLIYIFIQPDCYSNFAGVSLYTICLFADVMIAMPVVLSFLSLSYQHFFESEE